MIFTDISGRKVDVIPYHRKHLFIELLRGEGLSSGLFVSEGDDYPRTEAVVVEVPRFQDEIKKHYPEGIEVGDHIVTKRYAYTFFAWDWGWEPIEVVDQGAVPYSPFPIVLGENVPTKEDEVFSRREIFVVNIEDVECLVGQVAA